MLTSYKYLRQRILNVIFLVFTFKFHFSCSLFDSFNYMIQIITICTCSIMGVWTCYTVLSTVRRESKLTTMVWYFSFKWYMHLKWKWKIVFYQQVNMLIFYQVNMPYYIKFIFLIFVLHKFVISGPSLIIFFANGFGFDWLIFFHVLTPLLSTALGLSEWRQVFIGVGSQIVRRKPLTVDWNGVHLYHRIRKSQPQTGYSDYSSYYLVYSATFIEGHKWWYIVNF